MKASTDPAVCIERDAETLSPCPDHLRQNVDFENPTEVQNLHAAIRREDRGSRVTIKPFSLRVLVVCGLTIFFAGFFSSRYGDNVSGTSVELGDAVQSESALKTVPATPNVPVADQSTIADSDASGVVHVVMRNMKFSPASVEIKPGETVEWNNEDITPHTATSAPLFDSGSIDSDKSWRHTFTEPGNFPYICTFHPDMKATVTVKY
jgi:plastocyanin